MCWAFYRISEISKSVFRLSERFFSKSALPLSNQYPECVDFKHLLFHWERKILTTVEFLKGWTLASWINWRRLGFSSFAMRDICSNSEAIKAFLILNQLPGFIVLMNKTIFLSKSFMFLFVLWGYLLLIFLSSTCNKTTVSLTAV